MAKKKKPKKRKAKVYNYKSKITQAIRKIWYWSPAHREVKERCKYSKDLYRCERCRILTDKVQIDHDPPVTDPVKGWEGYDIFVERMFVDPKVGLKALCIPCHKRITDAQNIVRKENRKK